MLRISCKSLLAIWVVDEHEYAQANGLIQNCDSLSVPLRYNKHGYYVASSSSETEMRRNISLGHVMVINTEYVVHYLHMTYSLCR